MLGVFRGIAVVALVLFRNGLSGNEIGALFALKTLHLGDNELNGEIPAALGDVGAALNALSLSGNGGLGGCVPAALREAEYSDLDALGMGFCG